MPMFDEVSRGVNAVLAEPAMSAMAVTSGHLGCASPLVPSPPSLGEKVRMRGPSGLDMDVGERTRASEFHRQFNHASSWVCVSFVIVIRPDSTSDTTSSWAT